MKKGHLETGLLILFFLLHFGCKLKLTMARHAHPHRSFNLDECRRCGPGYGVTRHCNRHHDTECGPCAPGRYYSSHRSAHRPCYPCSRCGVGLYVAHRCTPTRDTVCDSCHTFRGPRNHDFEERCVIGPHLNDTAHLTAATKATLDGGVPTSIVIVSGVAVCVLLSVVLAATCYVVASSRRNCKRVDHRYEAVATQEAVML